MFNRIRKRLRKLIKLLPQKSQFLHSFQHSDLVIPGKHPENESSDEMLRQPRKIYLDKNGNQGTIWAGRHTRVNQVSFYGGHANDVLVLGSFCTLGRGSRIFLARERGADRVTNFPVGDIFSGTQLAEMAFLTRIDNDVSIGEGAMILPGVHIHNGAVVEPGSVVTQDVAAYAVVAGCPAVFRSWRIENDQQRQEMEALAWWEWKDRLIHQRKKFFTLSVGDALELAKQEHWSSSHNLPGTFLHEIPKVFQIPYTANQLDALVCEFLAMEDSARLLYHYKTLSIEDLAVWAALLVEKRPETLVELGTHAGCSSLVLARLCRFLDLPTHIVTIDVKDNVIHRDPGIEYAVEDFTGKMEQVWQRWDPDILFQDAHPYHLLEQQVSVGRAHPRTIHLFHDVGFRVFKHPMQIPLDQYPTTKTGCWERHILAKLAPPILDPAIRHFEDGRVWIHIFDAYADPRELGLGVLKFL